MFKKVAFVFFIIPVIAVAQGIFHVTTIDSFVATQAHLPFYGVGDMDAVYYNGEIHFVLTYQPDDGTPELRYYVRSPSGYYFETIDTIPAHPYIYTAIHMDSDGLPWIFITYGGQLVCYHLDGNSWHHSIVDTTVEGWTIATVKNEPNEIGVFYWRQYANWIEKLHYAYWDGVSWSIETAFDDLTARAHDYSAPSAVKVGNELYVAFTHLATYDSAYADSTVLHVCRRSNGTWMDDFYYFLYYTPDYNYWNEAGPALLGISYAGELHLWQTGAGWGTAGGVNSYLIKTGEGWTFQPPDTMHYGIFIRSRNNLQFSSNHTAFYVSEDNGFNPYIVWRSSDGTYGVNTDIPYYSAYPYEVWLFEPVITPDDTLHVFFWNGYGDSSYFITFKEATVYTGDLLGIGEHHTTATKLKLWNYPNPFQRVTTIQYSIPYSGHVKLTIYDLQGRVVKPLIDKRSQPGTYVITWYGDNVYGKPVPAGVYFCKLVTSTGELFHKLILCR